MCVGAFVFVGIAAAIGAIQHSLVWSVRTDATMRAIVDLFIAFGVALVGVGALRDLLGERVAKGAAPVLLLGAAAIGLIQWIKPETSMLLTVFGAAVLCTALFTYLDVTLRNKRPGSGLMLTGIVVTMVGTAIQAGESIRITLIWPFSYDGILHMMQIVALAFLAKGVVKEEPEAGG